MPRFRKCEEPSPEQSGGRLLQAEEEVSYFAFSRTSTSRQRLVADSGRVSIS